MPRRTFTLPTEERGAVELTEAGLDFRVQIEGVGERTVVITRSELREEMGRHLPEAVIAVAMGNRCLYTVDSPDADSGQQGIRLLPDEGALARLIERKRSAVEEKLRKARPEPAEG